MRLEYLPDFTQFSCSSILGEQDPPARFAVHAQNSLGGRRKMPSPDAEVPPGAQAKCFLVDRRAVAQDLGQSLVVVA
jgi:hypothetical protein